jgi:guanylate kinase
MAEKKTKKEVTEVDNEVLKQLFLLLNQVESINETENQILELLETLKSVKGIQELLDKALENSYEAVKKDLKEKIEFIQQHSDQVCVITGQSGAGKGMIVNLLKEEYGFHETPFVTTRDLRASDVEDSKEVTSEEFLVLEGTGQLFLAVSAYGNLYGYNIDKVIELLKQGKNIVVEAPPNRVLSEVDYLLPNAVTVVVIPEDDEFTRQSLANRGTEGNAKQKIRVKEGAADRAHCFYLLGYSDVYAIMTMFGEEEHARSQVRQIFERKLNADHKLCKKNKAHVEVSESKAETIN